jgi:hypothetical protein
MDLLKTLNQACKLVTVHIDGSARHLANNFLSVHALAGEEQAKEGC